MACLSYLSTSSCLQLFRKYDHLTRPLCSSPITGPSSLLRVGPPQSPASVLSPHGFGRLCFSLGIRELVPAVPRKSLCPTHAPYTPVAVRTVIRLPADLSQEKKAPLVLTTLTCSRSCLELLIRRSPPRLFTAAARTGLEPAPESRSRWACHHLLRSFTVRISVHFEPLSVPLQHTLFLGVDRDHRLLLGQGGGHLGVDPGELPIPVGVAVALLGLAVGLQAVARRIEQFGHQGAAHLVALRLQRLRQPAHALAGPPQRRFRIPACRWFDQRLEIWE